MTVPRRVVRRALLVADNVFQLERLYAFNKKFFPEWRPRYLCVEKLTDLPLVGLAYLHVEQLLVPPGPWNRGGTRGSPAGPLLRRGVALRGERSAGSAVPAPRGGLAVHPERSRRVGGAARPVVLEHPGPRGSASV